MTAESFFIPEKVGLPEETFGSWIEADHPWFEILPEEFTETDQKEEVDLTVNQLIENFPKWKGNWENDEYSEASQVARKNEPVLNTVVLGICFKLCYLILGYAVASKEIQKYIFDKIQERFLLFPM